MRPRCWVRRWWVRRSPPPWAPPQRCAAAVHWTPCLSGARWRGWAASCPEPRCEPDVHRNMGILQRVSTPHGKIAMCFNATWEYCNDCYMFQHHIGNIATMATCFNATLQSEHRTHMFGNTISGTSCYHCQYHHSLITTLPFIAIAATTTNHHHSITISVQIGGLARVQLRLCGWCWFSFGFVVGVGGLKGGRLGRQPRGAWGGSQRGAWGGSQRGAWVGSQGAPGRQPKDCPTCKVG